MKILTTGPVSGLPRPVFVVPGHTSFTGLRLVVTHEKTKGGRGDRRGTKETTEEEENGYGIYDHKGPKPGHAERERYVCKRVYGESIHGY